MLLMSDINPTYGSEFDSFKDYMKYNFIYYRNTEPSKPWAILPTHIENDIKRSFPLNVCNFFQFWGC